MRKISYAGYRFPPEVIHQAIWLYLRFTLSFRDVEDLLAERGIVVSYETVRRWVIPKASRSDSWGDSLGAKFLTLLELEDSRHARSGEIARRLFG